MKNNGFIATTLIYSFFLVFCAILLSYIALSTYNKNLIAKANENIRKDINEKTIGDIEYGSYFKIEVKNKNVESKDINWIVFNNKNNGETELVSSGIVFNKYIYKMKDFAEIKSAVVTYHNECLSSKVRLLTKSDMYNVMKQNAKNTRVLKNFLNVDNANESINYLLYNESNDSEYWYNYIYKEPTGDFYSLSEFQNVALNNNEPTTYNRINPSTGDYYDINSSINVRLVITLPSDIKIVGGNGSYSNPYVISTENCFRELSLINNILANGYNNKSNYTNPGKAVALADEGVRTTSDDYGTSYYFRGDVKNNYLIFAGKCWRIVRITGNNAIKIVLQNDDGIGCSEYTTAGSSKYNDVSGLYNTSAGVGFMYGNKDSTNYLEAQANTYDSRVLLFLKDWYDNSFTENQRNELADVIWCNDKRISGSYSLNNSLFMAKIRIDGDGNSANIAPSLVCFSSGDSNLLSRFTASDITNGNGTLKSGLKEYKIGLLTADEVAYAGGVYSSNNNKFYLYGHSNNASSWLLTPSSSNMVYTLDGYNGTIGLNTVNTSVGIRPVVALSQNTKIVAGDGSLDNPYVVE